MQPRRITSVDKTYKHGDLSVFPHAVDGKTNLYEAVNNAETKLKTSVTTNGHYLSVEDASSFPSQGLLKINGPGGDAEIVYYGRKIGNQFHLLQRGFAGYRQGPWTSGCTVSCPVMAEHHNALKDAIIKIQKKIGLAANPEVDSIHGAIRTLEQKWLSPKAIFKAFPRMGVPELTVRFKNFSNGADVRFLWDFGDGTNSTEKDPTHTYVSEGIYTVKLNMVTATGARGFTEKANYITVNNDQRVPFFYARPLHGISEETEFRFTDQTDGNIVERHWFFGDGEDITISNPNLHTIKHIYKKPGDYVPVLMIRYNDDQLSRANIVEGISVI
jgi:PKD repeat protein